MVGKAVPHAWEGSLESIGTVVADAQALDADRPGLDGSPRWHMTRWLDPAEAYWTGKLTKRAFKQDDRDAHAVTHPATEPTALPRYEADPDGAFWFDYVADMGDAFDPTMQIAWMLGRRSLTYVPKDGIGSAVPLPRGSLLVLGGDEVYPYASAAHYRNQLELPYGLAGEADPPGTPEEAGHRSAEVFAIPGNHDWWGGLRHWRSVFCRGDGFGRWRTNQVDSWFAVALPHRWWIWGLDTFLDGTINAKQHEFFDMASEQLAPGDRVLLCTPIPLWRLRETQTDQLAEVDRFVAERITAKGATVPVYLGGDSHIFATYERHRDGLPPELHVTSGGGGAFLHPTHNITTVIPRAFVDGEDTSGVDRTPFTAGQFWPSPSRSREHLVGRLWHAVLDRQSVTLALALGVFHGVYAWRAGAELRDTEATGRGFDIVLRALLSSWPATAWTVGVALLFLKFGTGFALPDTQEVDLKRIARRVGALHGVVQSISVVASAALAHRLVWSRNGGWPSHGGLRAGVVAGVIGGALSTAVLIAYLLNVNRRYRINGNESFAAQHFTDGKHFLRCTIDAAGALTLRLVAVPEGRRRWAKAYRSGSHVPPGATGGPVEVGEVPWTVTIPG